MTTIAEPIKLSDENLARTLDEVCEKLDSADGEVLLDFSAIARIDPKEMRALEGLAGAAEAKSVRIGLRGVNVDVYKVLKLARLAARFSIVN